MATDPILSKAMTLSFNSKVIARCTDFTLEINKEVIDITALDAAGWKKKLVDLKDWKVSFNGLITRGSDTTYGVYDDLLSNILTSDSTVPVAVTDTDASGTITLSGNAFLTALNLAAKVGDKASYSGTLEGDGELALS